MSIKRGRCGVRNRGGGRHEDVRERGTGQGQEQGGGDKEIEEGEARGKGG